MGVIAISSYPILIELLHNDQVDHQYTDEWGTIDVFKISSIHFLNRTSEQWTLIAADESGRNVQFTINPQQEGTINIPTPQRPDSAPLSFGLTFVRT